MKINFDLEFLDGGKEPTVFDGIKAAKYLGLLNSLASSQGSESPYEIQLEVPNPTASKSLSARSSKSPFLIVKEGLYASLFIVDKKTQVRTRVPLSAIVAFGQTYGLDREELVQPYSHGIEENLAPTFAEAMLRTMFFSCDAPYAIPGQAAWDVLMSTFVDSGKYDLGSIVRMTVDGVNNEIFALNRRADWTPESIGRAKPLVGDYLQNLEYKIRTHNLQLPVD